MILVIDSERRAGVLLSDMLCYMGIVSRAVTPAEAPSVLSPLYRAILVQSPEALADAEGLVGRLRSYAPSTPIFSISTVDDGSPLFDLSFPKGISAAELLAKITDYATGASLELPGSYILSGLDASVGHATAMLFGRPLGLTRTEAMILRYLIRCYPTPCTAEDILLHAYRAGRRPEPSGVRTHICIINRKYRKIRGRNLIFSLRDEGYKILTTEDALEPAVN
ncbi:MAG: response regulator transcription factor [Clostridia bacterium]|nr:response regulator transcription factor [Clostridia bacterium]